MPRVFFNEPVVLKRGHVYSAGLLFGLASSVLVIVITVMLIRVNDLNKERANQIRETAAANQRDIQLLQRIQELQKPPTDEEIARAARRALRVCARDPKCRDIFLVVIRRTRFRGRTIIRTRTRTVTKTVRVVTTPPPSARRRPTPRPQPRPTPRPTPRPQPTQPPSPPQPTPTPTPPVQTPVPTPRPPRPPSPIPPIPTVPPVPPIPHPTVPPLPCPNPHPPRCR